MMENDSADKAALQQEMKMLSKYISLFYLIVNSIRKLFNFANFCSNCKS